jgi:membrane protein implicated in regulation of membrane protease activity
MVLMEFLAANAPWAWIIAGLILLALELFVPGGYLLWLGIAGLITGLVVLVEPIAWPFQWLMFGVLALVAIVLWTRWNRNRPSQSDRPYLNRRGDSFVGHEAVLEQPIAGGFGRLTLGDTIWRISGSDMPAGQRIRIVGSEGAVLIVEAI